MNKDTHSDNNIEKKSKELENRLKKLEERFKYLRDSNDENTSSIEDLYDTVNNFKSFGYDSNTDEDYIPSRSSLQSSSSSSSLSSSNLALDKQYIQGAITKNEIIDNILAEYINKKININSPDLKLFLEYLSDIYPLNNTETNNEFAFQGKIKHALDYFITLTSEKQSSIIASITNTKKYELARPPIFTILEAPLSEYHKQIAINKLHMLEEMDKADAEYYKLKQWLDNLLAIPFGIYKEPAFLTNTKTHKNNLADVLKNAKEVMNNAIYGQQKTKQHIMEIVARMITNPSSRGSVFAVEGSAGVGKTSLIKRGLAPIFNLPFQFISLGGARDVAYLAGENYTYIGSKPGLIIQAIKNAGCMNPIFYFDELDKVSDTPHGQEIINLLIHITDPAQNDHFQDMYLDGIPIDLSRALFIFSFNNRALINPILLDRMEIIKFDKYSYQDKVVIIEKYLLPEITSEYFGSSKSDKSSSGNVKIILRNKKKVFQTLILNINSSMNSRVRKIGKGIIKSRKLTRRRISTRGIRCIKRKLEKAIARKNLEELLQTNGDKQHNNKIRKIIITSNDFE